MRWAIALSLTMGCTTSRPPTNASPAAVRASADSPVTTPNTLPFHVWHEPWSKMQAGDAIEISTLHGPERGCAIGKEYVVTGRYKLTSRESAQLAIYATNGQLQQNAMKRVVAGRGQFRFVFIVEKPGKLHVSYYPDGKGGESFGGVYFACD